MNREGFPPLISLPCDVRLTFCSDDNAGIFVIETVLSHPHVRSFLFNQQHKGRVALYVLERVYEARMMCGGEGYVNVSTRI